MLGQTQDCLSKPLTMEKQSKADGQENESSETWQAYDTSPNIPPSVAYLFP